MLPLPCVIVAGGKSSRMGRDKALLPFGSFETLSEFQLNRLKDCFSSLHVSCKTKDKFSFNANFIEDTDEFKEYSPLVAIYSILKEFSGDVCILSVDTPFVTCSTFEKLFFLKQNFDVAIAKSSFGSHQLCGIYSTKILPLLKKQLNKGEHKIRDFLNQVKTTYVEFDNDEEFVNLNYFDEYKKAKEKV